MTHTLRAPSQLFAIGLLALTGLAANNPVAHLVDCTDSFWAIACAQDAGVSNSKPEQVNTYDVSNSEPAADVIIGEPIRIDNDPICVEIDGGFIVCHT